MSEAPQVSPQRQSATARGGCLCGAVRFEIQGPLRSIIYCHCAMCRRSNGHFVAATACESAHLRLLAAETLRWYQSSAAGRRAFCGTCGSQLFWERANSGRISIWAGTLDTPTGLAAAAHIFVADKGDYYEIADGLPQWPGASPWPGNSPPAA